MKRQGQPRLWVAALAASPSLLLLVLVLAGCSPSPPSHGVRFVLAPVTNGLAFGVTPSELSNTINILKKRIDLAGLRPPFTEQSADETIVLKFRRLSPKELARVRASITNVGLVEFRMVHPESPQLVANNIIDPGCEILRMPVMAPNGMTSESLLVNKKPQRGLTGRYIKRAYVTRDKFTDRLQIGFELDAEGAELFAEITREFSPAGQQRHRLAIVLDGMLVSAPVIAGPIVGGRAVIDGHFSMSEAVDLVIVLEQPFRVPLRIVDERDF